MSEPTIGRSFAGWAGALRYEDLPPAVIDKAKALLLHALTGGLLGANARAALLTRGLAEMSRLGHAIGARPQTFMGLACLGDLLLTATGDLSRNRRVGLALARGESIAQIVQQLGHVAEGVSSAPALLALARRSGVEVPITAGVCKLIDGHWTAQQAIAALLDRKLRDEFEG